LFKKNLPEFYANVYDPQRDTKSGYEFEDYVYHILFILIVIANHLQRIILRTLLFVIKEHLLEGDLRIGSQVILAFRYLNNEFTKESPGNRIGFGVMYNDYDLAAYIEARNGFNAAVVIM